MKRRTVLLIVSCLVAIVLGLAACSPAAVTSLPPTSSATSVTPTTLASVTPPTTAGAEKPKYGGMITQAANPLNGDPGGRFDSGTWMVPLLPALYVTTESLIQGDWTKGPAGTGETDWLEFLGNNFDLVSGRLAESWELPDATTIIFHIRHGVHFWNKPPANGREMTADDVVWNINRQWFTKEPVFNTSAWPPGSAPTSVKALDKYTVQLTCAAAAQGLQLLATGQQVYMIPPEVVQQYGDANNWQHYIGTGPFMIQDYVPSSSITYSRNPNYWETNPIGPGKGDQLPYADGLTTLFIPDASTMEAAFRTGKIDSMGALSWDDYNALSKQVPASVQHVQTYGQVYNLVGRMDKQDLPFKDVKVRQALNMAVDQKSILDSYYEGHGELLSWPFYSGKDWTKGYIPLDQLPQEDQNLFSYNPDKAKQILAEAGYPNGFKTSIVTTQPQVDLLSIVKQQLAQVGVDLTINVVDPGVYNNLDRGRSFDQMIFKVTKMYFIPWQMNEVRVVNFDDDAYFDDPKVNAAYNELLPYVGKDSNKVWQILKDITPYMIGQCPMGIYMPVPYNYNMWWPWLKNFYSATSIGNWDPGASLKYVWIDQDLKSSMGH